MYNSNNPYNQQPSPYYDYYNNHPYFQQQRAQQQAMFERQYPNLYGQNQPQQQNNQITEPESQTPTIIPVSSAEEAWNYPADFTGRRQFFINRQSSAIYEKWFDANIPDTFRKIYKEEAVIEKEKTKSEIITRQEEDMLAKIMNSLGTLESEITELKIELKELLK